MASTKSTLLSAAALAALTIAAGPAYAQATAQDAPPASTPTGADPLAPTDDRLATDAPETEPAEGRSTDDDETATQAVATSSGDILVTAQRREERVQDIPVAISAFGEAQITRTGIVSLEQIAPRVPSFYFGSFGASRPQLYIRGIGTRSFDPGSESSVGVFVDEVYLGRSSGSFGSLKDIERIEVLRGPQGTLYGRNTIGGAINVISNAPTQNFEARLEAGISNYDGYEIEGAVGGPITSDGSLMFRVAGWRSYRDGYLTNLTTGNTFLGVDNFGGRARLAFVPNDRLRIDLTAELVRDDDEAAFAGFNRGSGRVFNFVTGVTTPPNPRSVFLGNPARVPIVYTGGNEGFLTIDPTLYRKAETYIGRLEYDLDFATITSISAVRKLRTEETRDLEGASINALNQVSMEESDQFTQEIRLTSDRDGALSLGGALDWIVGGFYYRDRSERSDAFLFGPDSIIAAIRIPATAPPIGPQTSVAAAEYEIDSYAAFAQATLHIGEKFDVTAGARYTRDEKRAVQIGTNTRPGVPLVAVPFTVDNSAVYTSFDPRIVATYKFNRDVNVYASFSTGFKSGGFQYVPFSAAQANVLFDPEDIKTYEVGLKSEWLNRTLQVNVAGFYYDYKDLQVSRIVDLGGGAAASLIDNAANSTVKGFEVEMALRPSSNIDFNVAYGYLDAQYDEYTTNAPGTPVTPATNFSNTRMVRAPKHSITVGGEWRIPLADEAGLTLRADYALLDEFFHEPGEANPVFGGAVSQTREESYGLLDLRAAVDYRNFRVTAFVTNVFNTDYRRTVLALGSTLSDFPGQPRLYGLRVGYRY